MKDQFIQFLRDHKVLIKYRAGLKNIDKNIDTFIDKNNPEDYLYFAFDWNVTPSGYYFWHDLSEQWYELLKKKS